MNIIAKIYKSRHYLIRQYIPMYIYKLGIPSKVRKLRKKEVIDVVFVISELGAWKTESLYLAMKSHSRFRPHLAYHTSKFGAEVAESLKQYLEAKMYSYVNVDDKKEWDKLPKDLIFYQKPYEGIYPNHLRDYNNRSCLFCHVPYFFHQAKMNFAYNIPVYLNSWQLYAENDLVAEDRALHMKNQGKNLVITGTPVMDDLNKNKDSYLDPWKSQTVPKKRIIYAPHHTISNLHADGIDISTFLYNGDAILSLAKKYADKVQWAFKPHPVLYSKLVTIWGQDRADAYYNAWKNLENGQLELGKYEALFMYSDAMIHDCSTFVVEYLYTQKPVLFLLKEAGKHMDYTDFGMEAFNAHYMAQSIEEIECFIKDVIEGVDSMKAIRSEFCSTSLRPPYGKLASENIINSILGQEEYANYTFNYDK